MRLSGLKKLMPTAHFERMQGSVDENEHYCSKPHDGCTCKHCKDCPDRLEGPWYRGEKPKPGTRTDWKDFRSDCKELTHDELAEKYTRIFVTCNRGFTAAYTKWTGKERGMPVVIILYGPSGTGKSLLASQMFPEAYRKPKNKWWDHYTGQDVVIFDDFYSWISYDDMLRMLDWYALMVETKGGTVHLTTQVFVFTSNKSPEDWYSNVPDRSALTRRLKEYGTVVEITKQGMQLKKWKDPAPQGAKAPYYHSGPYLCDL